MLLLPLVGLNIVQNDIYKVQDTLCRQSFKRLKLA